MSDERPVPTVPSGLVLAHLGRRALGAVLDQFLVLLPVAVAIVAVGYQPGDELDEGDVLLITLAAIGVGFVYQTVMIGALGRTVGKIATGTRVVSVVQGGPIGWFGAVQRAMVPALAAAVPSLSVLLGSVVYGLAFFGPLRQGLHDRAAGSVVVMAG